MRGLKHLLIRQCLLKLKSKIAPARWPGLFLPGRMLGWWALLFIFGALAGGVYLSAKSFWAQRREQQTAALMAAAELLHQIWQGDLTTVDYARKTLCVGDKWPAYDPDILQCLFAKNPYLTVARGQRVKVLAAFKNQSGQKLFYALETKANTPTNFLPHYHFRLAYGQTWDVLLEVPRDTYLPERIYAYGPQGTKNDLRLNRDWRFDNFGLRIFIDRRPVSFREIKHWVDFGQPSPLPFNFFTQQTMLNPREMDRSWDYPAHGLSPAQMEAYCQFLGGELLRAEWFDGGSFHPGDYEMPRPKYVLRKKYPWNNEQTAINCALLFSAECPLEEYSVYHKSGLSWMGLQQTLGGIPELMRDISGKYVVKASSYFLPRSSPWHELGKRWPYDAQREREIGFRCMYYE